MKEHEKLRGQSDHRLRVLAPDATHQHFKGGLYRLLGTAMDADTGEPIYGKDGHPRVAYLHCYPYPKQVWVRDYVEFFGEKNGQPRYREIEGALQT